MKTAALAAWIGEKIPLPDVITRKAIDIMVGRTSQRLAVSHTDGTAAGFAAETARYPIAIHTDEANDQHYELPAEFFAAVLGPQRKYSCCLYHDGAKTLAGAEEAALAATAAHAGLADGQSILELGCGWGSLSLWMARQFPNARIQSVSNSASQGLSIRERAQAEGLDNLEVVTADMNAFTMEGNFDRIVSVEMFEHMSNWRPLLERARAALKSDGRVFIHIFTHRTTPYRFDHTDPSNWIARYFFTGGIMPSHDLVRHFGDLFAVEEEWQWNGRNYARTADDWLNNMDSRLEEIERILRGAYGADWRLWRQRWRLFFLATSGLFGYGDGSEWAVSHYRLKPS